MHVVISTQHTALILAVVARWIALLNIHCLSLHGGFGGPDRLGG